MSLIEGACSGEYQILNTAKEKLDRDLCAVCEDLNSFLGLVSALPVVYGVHKQPVVVVMSNEGGIGPRTKYHQSGFSVLRSVLIPGC